MFDNNGFYPTPEPLARKLFAPYEVEHDGRRYFSGGSSIFLEPSAGKGDLVDYLTDGRRVRRQNIYCIEADPNLRHILQGKGYRVVDSDFLTYDDPQVFDMIVMNPPFADGDKHLLKAWDVVRPGGRIACILNAETIRNPYSRQRRLLLEIIRQHGRYEFAGRPFVDAERPTDVEVALVWLEKPESETVFTFDGEGMERETKIDEASFSANPLAHANIIESLVAQYERARDVLVQKAQVEAEYRFYISGVVDTQYDEEKAPRTLNEELDALKKSFWRYLFNKTRIGKVTTSDFQKKFDEFSEQQAAMAFNVANIEEVLRMFFLNRDQIMEDCLTQVFDTATSYHERNKVHVEGWKTNKSWKINRKVIIPGAVAQDWRWRISYHSRAGEFLRDIDKVLCYLSGKPVDGILTAVDALTNRFGELADGGDYTEKVHSTFFQMRFFKKGTLHLEFLDEDLWNELNVRAAKNKNWVGPGY